MSVFLLCEQAIGLVRGKRLVLDSDERGMLEALNYEGLTAAHAQDEAVVCALHFARVRDRLLQAYAWTFARKKATLTSGGTLPSDYLAMLYVLVDGEPVDYEVSGTKLNITTAAEIHYTARITDTTQWSSVFSDIFCYALAIEICSAVTGKPEYAQILEQKEQELIHRAIQIGEVKAEVKLSLSQEIYNRAIGLSRGVRSVATTSAVATEQGIDNSGIPNDRVQAEIQACKRASDSVRDRLLQSYPWLFARKSATLSTERATIEGWEHGYKRPEDCLKVLTVIADSEPVEFEETEAGIFTNALTPTVRYTSKITSMSSWPGSFVDVFVCELAQEIVMATTHNLDTVQLLEQKSQLIIQAAYNNGIIKEETQIPLKDGILKRAVMLSAGVKDSDNTNSDRYLRSIAIARSCYESARDRLLQLYPWTFARKKATLAAGSDLPSNVLTVLAVFVDGAPIEFERVGRKLNITKSCEYRYIARITDEAEWDGAFKDLLCYELAKEIVTATTAEVNILQALEQKSQIIVNQAYKSGVVKSDTPILLTEELHNRAITLSHGTRNYSGSGETANSQGLDIAGEQNTRTIDEINACTRAADDVEKKLFELYPWTFTKKSSTLTSAATIAGWSNGYDLPSDCLNVLCLIVGGQSVEYERTADKVFCNGTNATIRYTTRISDKTKWPSLFRDVYCYMLAVEVVLATTANADIVQLLELKAAQIIQQAYNTGLIKDETNIPITEEIYKRAIMLSEGVRDISQIDKDGVASFSNSKISTERRTRSLAIAKASYESVRDRTLQLFPWIFARKVTTINAGANLPSDLLSLLAVFVNNIPVECEQHDNKLSLTTACEIHYTAKITDSSKWDGAFKDIFCYELAKDIVMATTADANTLQLLEQKIQLIAGQAYKSGVIKAETHTELTEEIYNRAMALSHGVRTLSGAGESANTQGTDILGRQNSRTVEEINACKRAANSVRERLLQLYPWTFAKRTKDNPDQIEAITGWKYGYSLSVLPMAILAVYSNGEPIDFEVQSTSSNHFYCNSENVSVVYISESLNMSVWPGIFQDAFCYELAQEIILATTGNSEQIALLEQKKQALIVDAYKSGAIKFETRIPVKQELFNRAIGLVKGQKRDQQLDMRNNRYEDEISACKRAFDSARKTTPLDESREACIIFVNSLN